MGLAGKEVEDTATGNPLTFLTDLARPLKSLLIPFTPVQSGTGDPSPQNIRSILPWNGLTVGQINGTAPVISNNAGMENVNGEWKNTGTDTKTRFDAYIQLFKGSTYIKGAGSKSITSPGIYSITFNVDDANCNRIVFLHSGSRDNLSIKFPFELSQGTYTISFNVVSANPSVVGGLTIKDIFLVAGSDVQRTETDISFPSPVYGGTLDVVSGVLTVEYGFITLDDSVPVGLANWRVFEGSSAWLYSLSVVPSDTASNSAICDKEKQNAYGNIYNGSFGVATNIISGDFGLAIRIPVENLTTEEAIHAYLAENPYHVAYKLATPQEITLTPQQITALKGENTIWSDADGSMTAVYFKKG